MSKSALERIKEIEKSVEPFDIGKGEIPAWELKFLLRAFKIAMEMLREANQHTHDVYGDCWFKDIDQEFEKGMTKDE